MMETDMDDPHPLQSSSLSSSSSSSSAAPPSIFKDDLNDLIMDSSSVHRHYSSSPPPPSPGTSVVKVDLTDDALVRTPHLILQDSHDKEECKSPFFRVCPERHKIPWEFLSYPALKNHISLAFPQGSVGSFKSPTAKVLVSRPMICSAVSPQCKDRHITVNDSKLNAQLRVRPNDRHMSVNDYNEYNSHIAYYFTYTKSISSPDPSTYPQCCEISKVILNLEPGGGVEEEVLEGEVRRASVGESVDSTTSSDDICGLIYNDDSLASDKCDVGLTMMTTTTRRRRRRRRRFSSSQMVSTESLETSRLKCRSSMCVRESRTLPKSFITSQHLVSSSSSSSPSSSTRNVASSSMPKLKFRPCSLLLWWGVLLTLASSVGVRASEFPDRECCDSAPPPPPHYHTTTSTTPVPLLRFTSSSTTSLPPSFFPTSSIPPTGEGALGVRNCLLARQLCADDLSCRSVLEIIPRVCGPESVACSTVTVNKCLAALRTIQGFPYFQPTCLCREPHLDRECNIFREFIFDHPCIFVENKEVSPYAVHALPLCEYALNACETLPGCITLYEEFREACRERDDQCRMVNTSRCLSSWTKLKMSPMFGCICPMDRQKRKCERIFRRVHNNPCVDTLPASAPPPSPGQGGAGGVWELILPPPSTPRRPTLRPRLPLLPPPYPPHHRPRPHLPWAVTPVPPHATLITAEPLPAYSAQTHNVLTVDRHTTPRTGGNSHGSFAVSVIPYDNSSLYAVDTQIQNPLMEAGQGGGRRQNASRAANVLGSDRRYPTGPHTSHTASPSDPVPVLHSTCQTALTGCTTEPTCRRLLDPVLAMCDNDCNREACMSNLQTFYRNVESKWALEVAFCLCKKSSKTANECLTAQEKLHPSCARKPAGPVPMLCNRLAAACKEDNGCRHRLEFYEQACAVDSDTRRCAGSTAECRRAVLGILGTQLRNLCTCATSDPREAYVCMDWQRILWFNPCVVESQTDYHREMLAALNPGEEMTTSSSIVFTPSVTTGIVSEPVQKWPPVIYPTATTSSSYFPGPTHPKWNVGVSPPTMAPTTTTTTTLPTTTLPPKYCEKRHTNVDPSHPSASTVDFIEEGSGKRFYKDQECSELCLCHAEEKLACSVLECVEARPCETGYAVYTHSAPAYQASRGECFCYSGSFICVRPPQNSYNTNLTKEGIFLFIGYSKAEELLLRPYTKSSLVNDAMNKLGDMVRESSLELNGTECRLEVVTHVDENIILQATLEEFEDSRDNMTVAMHNEEKEACERVVTEVGRKINNHAKEVREDMALSVLILAEVQAHIPQMPDSATLARSTPLLLPLLLAALSSLQHLLLAS